ncbi:hypothetical protein GGR88_001371 [Sphingomonas jejuensis]|uniref:Uncharacterized protein n=1 Tax=Sphingomonas jejuensis TaxID=904715 RepID=A0ABX0XKK4_9SPHN|nr:hypothetical protein [Sphingomonas jejuensis]NJC33897.1 hypothetical protein [Sphingomonas jejuensis]
MTLSNWTARPSGNSLTITGRDSTGVATRITGVEQVWPQGSHLQARDGRGTIHQLVMA